MSNDVTLAHLAAAIDKLQQQMEQVNRRLDMIYGAVTRLAEPRPEKPAPAAPRPAPGSGQPISARMVMDPGSMLESLRQYAENSGLDISPETVDRLKAELAPEESADVGAA